jgi:hypothetical protein
VFAQWFTLGPCSQEAIITNKLPEIRNENENKNENGNGNKNKNENENEKFCVLQGQDTCVDLLGYHPLYVYLRSYVNVRE